MNEYDYKKEGVNVKIERETVISGLLLNGSIRNTANALGVSPSTIYRVCNEEGFKEAFNKARAEVLSGCVNKLISNLSDGVDNIVEIMNNKENSAQIRINATQLLFNTAIKLSENCGITKGISCIEEGGDSMANGTDKEISYYLRLAELCGIHEDEKRKEYMKKVERLLSKGEK